MFIDELNHGTEMMNCTKKENSSEIYKQYRQANFESTQRVSAITDKVTLNVS